MAELLTFENLGNLLMLCFLQAVLVFVFCMSPKIG